MMKIAIYDNENVMINSLESFILDICAKENIDADIDIICSLEVLNKVQKEGTYYDLLYLDTKMQNKDAIAIVHAIRKLDTNLLIVYLSDNEENITELFALDVFAFLKRPINEDAFLKTFLRAYRKIGNQNLYYVFHHKNEEYKILCENIMYFESMGKKINVHIQNSEVESFYGKLAEVENQLQNGKTPFLRIHQSYLVNYHTIMARSKTAVTLISGIKLPISEDRRKQFHSIYDKILTSEVIGKKKEL